MATRRDPQVAHPQWTDAELRAMEAETNYRNCRAMMLHYAKLAHAWRFQALQTRQHLPPEHYVQAIQSREADFYDLTA